MQEDDEGFGLIEVMCFSQAAVIYEEERWKDEGRRLMAVSGNLSKVKIR